MIQVLQRVAQQLYHWRRKVATAAIAALVLILGYHAVFGANGFLVFHQKRLELQKLDHEIQMLEEDNAHSQQQIKALKTDPQGIEKEAREHLHYAKDGEIIYKLPSATATPGARK